MGKKVKDSEYVFDDSAVKFASLSDEEATEQVNKVKDRITELQSLDGLEEDPRKIMELRNLKESLHWYKANKYRSKYFKIESAGRSMRKAKRHPEISTFKNRGDNAITSCKRKKKSGRKWKGLQILSTLFPRALSF